MRGHADGPSNPRKWSDLHSHYGSIPEQLPEAMTIDLSQIGHFDLHVSYSPRSSSLDVTRDYACGNTREKVSGIPKKSSPASALLVLLPTKTRTPRPFRTAVPSSATYRATFAPDMCTLLPSDGRFRCRLSDGPGSRVTRLQSRTYTNVPTGTAIPPYEIPLCFPAPRLTINDLPLSRR